MTPEELKTLQELRAAAEAIKIELHQINTNLGGLARSLSTDSVHLRNAIAQIKLR